MNFIKKMSVLLKKIFEKENTIKSIEEPKQIQYNKNQKNFKKSLTIQKKEKRVETLICVGDGLGIQPKITS